MNNQNIPNVMTTNEAASYTGMQIATIRRLAKEGKIPAKKIGDEWRFLRSTLESWRTNK